MIMVFAAPPPDLFYKARQLRYANDDNATITAIIVAHETVTTTNPAMHEPCTSRRQHLLLTAHDCRSRESLWG